MSSSSGKERAMNEQTATYTHSSGSQTVTVLGHNGEDMTHVRFENGTEVWVCDSDLSATAQPTTGATYNVRTAGTVHQLTEGRPFTHRGVGYTNRRTISAGRADCGALTLRAKVTNEAVTCPECLAAKAKLPPVGATIDYLVQPAIASGAAERRTGRVTRQWDNGQGVDVFTLYGRPVSERDGYGMLVQARNIVAVLDTCTKCERAGSDPSIVCREHRPEQRAAERAGYSGITESRELDSWRDCSHRADYASGAEHWQSCPAHGKDAQPAAGPREWAPLQVGDTVLARWDAALGQWAPAAWLNEANTEQYTVVELRPHWGGMLVRKFLRGQSGPRVWIHQGQYIRPPADAL